MGNLSSVWDLLGLQLWWAVLVETSAQWAVEHGCGTRERDVRWKHWFAEYYRPVTDASNRPWELTEENLCLKLVAEEFSHREKKKKEEEDKMIWGIRGRRAFPGGNGQPSNVAEEPGKQTRRPSMTLVRNTPAENTERIFTDTATYHALPYGTFPARAFLRDARQSCFTLQTKLDPL